jgi:hypothetical protein
LVHTGPVPDAKQTLQHEVRKAKVIWGCAGEIHTPHMRKKMLLKHTRVTRPARPPCQVTAPPTAVSRPAPVDGPVSMWKKIGSGHPRTWNHPRPATCGVVSSAPCCCLYPPPECRTRGQPHHHAEEQGTLSSVPVIVITKPPHSHNRNHIITPHKTSFPLQ